MHDLTPAPHQTRKAWQSAAAVCGDAANRFDQQDSCVFRLSCPLISVNRNRDRLHPTFLLQRTDEEFADWRLQIAASSLTGTDANRCRDQVDKPMHWLRSTSQIPVFRLYRAQCRQGSDGAGQPAHDALEIAVSADGALQGVLTAVQGSHRSSFHQQVTCRVPGSDSCLIGDYSRRSSGAPRGTQEFKTPAPGTRHVLMSHCKT